MRKYFLHVFVLGTIFGSLFYNFYPKSFWLVFVLSFLFLILGIFRTHKIYFLISIGFFVCGNVIIRGTSAFPKPYLPELEDQKITIVGQVVAEPDIRENNTRLIIQAEKIIDRNRWEKLNEKMIVVTPSYPEIEIGQKLKISGKIQIPQNFENDNGIEFNYINYLAKDRIYSQIYYPQVRRNLENKDDFKNSLLKKYSIGIAKYIFRVKKVFLEKIQRIIPSPEAELLGGILLGTKRSLGKELENNFRKTGLIHIIVLSGYNVTIIAEAIFRFFSFLPKGVATFLGVISVLVFMVMVGSGATVVRATIMTLLALTARITGRTYNVSRALFFAGAIMVFQNPMILVYDPSFQLSFLATLGIVYLGKPVEKILKFVPKKFELREIMAATLSTQFSVLPLLMKMTGELSIVAPIVNVLTLQVIPITMLLGFVSGLIGFINEFLGMYAGFFPYLFLKYILLVVNFFAGFEFATIAF